MNQCINCNSETVNSKFCSSSCAASHNNKIKPKRKRKLWFCKLCGKEVKSRTSYCIPECQPWFRDWSKVTLRDMRNRRAHQAHSAIRDNSRRVYSGPFSCYICGYDKHVDICHIRGINSFSPEAKISEINSLDNLLALCITTGRQNA
jgi:hypothetical protein